MTDSASDSLRESDPLKNHFQSPTLSTVLDNGTLKRIACDSSLFRRSSARHLSLTVWSRVPTLRSTLPTCIPSALLRTGHGGTVLGSLPVVSPVLRLLLWSFCGSATMLVKVFLTHSGVCAVVWLWVIHSLPGGPGTRELWMSCRDPRV